MTDYSLHFYDSPGGQDRSWADAVKYSFVAAGYNPTSNREMRKMKVEDRVWVRWTLSTARRRSSEAAGYVARGIVVREPAPVARAVIVDNEGNDVPFVDARHNMYGHYGSQSDADYSTRPGDEWAEWIAAVRWENVLDVKDRLVHSVVPKPSVSTGALTRPEDVAVLLDRLPVVLDADDRLEWNKGTPLVTTRAHKLAKRGGDNSESEQAAVAAVTDWYEEQGAMVTPLPNDDGLGYDLDVIHDGEHLLVEVKGRADGIPAAELENSQWAHVEASNPAWRLAVVTHSTSAPFVQVWTAKQVAEFSHEVTRRRVSCVE
ncbi:MULTISPECIES: protein NO VEIN domain-containing protein [unclassified Nocardioides]|uniref:protein NO VEIN domain-containing protein n=1 Tax=unclassified Nocardioides TaxID=2615069 RepID=UPI0006FCA2B6|nr:MULTISPECIES: DUF3883 domain-containing protein [unclassified Nocardioides]KRA32511.1 hypothetical protein ASD81_13220 [Nocardioides sp. Root614]KRA89165.1 hypothetical protein ASD84_13485 [Nocardioides sp. Root682]